MVYPRISENSMGGARGIIALLTWRYISCKFLDLKVIGEMPIYSLAYYITVGESASTDNLKYLMLYFKSAMAAGEIEVSDLYKTF